MLVRVGRKGVVVIPKALREAVNIGEGDELVAEVVGDAIVLRPLRPKVVDIDVEEADRVISEERREWERRLGETGS
jgi:AbrB family looped-hinge helix DNA binding protein